MSFVTAAKNTMLNALTFTDMSLHTAFPGATGANEVTGGAPAYARKAITMGVAAGAVRTLSAGVTFDVPVCTVAWTGFWNGATFVCYSPCNAAPKEFIADSGSDTIRITAHGYVANAPVVFFGDTPPAPLVEGIVYYVRDVTTDTFRVSAAPAGAAIDLTTVGGSACLSSAITQTVYAVQSTHSVTAATAGLPN